MPVHPSQTAKHSKTTPEHFTPREIVEAARRVLGRIDVDPATTRLANRRICATTYYTVETNGLDPETHWHGTVFLNPPGGKVKAFWHKLMEEIEECYCSAAIWVGFSTEQLQTLQLVGQETYPHRTPIDYPICIPRRRICFDTEDGLPQRSPTHANYLTYIGPDPQFFAEVFRQFGTVSLPGPILRLR